MVKKFIYSILNIIINYVIVKKNYIIQLKYQINGIHIIIEKKLITLYFQLNQLMV